MIQKKVCMLGSFAVGKTSLVARYVHGLFSEKYHTTVGVKVDKKELWIDATDVVLVLWDLYGEDEFQQIRTSYLRGMSGYLLVVDSTRLDTLHKAVDLQERARLASSEAPFLVLLNKSDLEADAQVRSADVERLEAHGWSVVPCSAKTGEGVQEAFTLLSRRMLEAQP